MCVYQNKEKGDRFARKEESIKKKTFIADGTLKIVRFLKGSVWRQTMYLTHFLCD